MSAVAYFENDILLDLILSAVISVPESPEHGVKVNCLKSLTSFSD